MVKTRLHFLCVFEDLSCLVFMLCCEVFLVKYIEPAQSERGDERSPGSSSHLLPMYETYGTRATHHPASTYNSFTTTDVAQLQSAAHH